MPDPTNHLLVPIHVDGLLLTKHVDAVAPLTDFAGLPHIGRDSAGHFVDANSSTPWLTDTVTSEPFASNTTSLEPGVHLHWALPDGLTRARHPVVDNIEDRSRLEFPTVPNRWLVVRRIFDVAQRSWIVESDHVWDPATPPAPSMPGTPQQRLVTWPIVALNNQGEAIPGLPPYRHVGRSRTLEPDAEPVADGTSLHDHNIRLTTVGHGEPTFAAFYPNCRNIFGLHDDAATDAAGLSYDVWGWYTNDDDDALGATVARAEKTFTFDPNRLNDAGDALSEEVQRASWIAQEVGRQLSWTWSEDHEQTPDQTAPRRLICHGRIRRGSFTIPAERPEPLRLSVSMGNTGTEALSAFIGERVAASHHPDDPTARAADKARVEDAIEALHLSPGLKRQVIDIGAKLGEARHTKGFTPSPGAQRWIVRARPIHADIADASTAPHPGAAVAPVLAHKLQTLNDAQRSHDRARRTTEARRWDVWADWHRCTASTIPADDEVAAFSSARGEHDIDLLLAGLRLRLADLAQSELISGPEVTMVAPTVPSDVWRFSATSESVAGGADTAAGSPGHATAGDQTTATRLGAALRDTSQAIVEHNRTIDHERDGVVWVLERAPGPRFWQPNDPAIVLTGADATPSDRHGAGATPDTRGQLECTVRGIDRSLLDPLGSAALTALDTSGLDDLEAQPGTVVGVRKGGRPKRHPFMLEWEADVAPIRLAGNASSLGSGFAPDFLRTTHTLDDADCRLTAAPALSTAVTAGTTIRGRGHLTDHARHVAMTTIEGYLRQRLTAWFNAQGTASAERSIDVLNRRHAEIRAWFAHVAADRRATIEGGELDRLQSLDPSGSVHGIANTGVLADAILRVVTEQEPVVLSDEIGLDPTLVDALVAERTASVSPLLLDQVSAVSGVDASVFARVLRWAHAGGWFATPNIATTIVRPAALVDDLPAHHGIPAGGAIEIAIIHFVNHAQKSELLDAAGVAPNVVAELLLNRPVQSFDGLHALPLMGPRSFAKLLHHVDRQAWLSGDLQVNPDPTRPAVDDDGMDVEDELAPVAVRGVRWADPILTVLDAWVVLRANRGVLTHTLSGFTDALLMRRRGWQLPVADPLGFVEYRAFAETVVAPAVGTPTMAPMLRGGFSPLRTGDVRLSQLRLVDTFGQARTIDLDHIVATEAMQTDRVLGATLPPRLSQPARLGFRWLDAGSASHGASKQADGARTPELTPHPARSPVNGWLVNNNLTTSIEVHQTSGEPVGSIDRTGRWRPPPDPTCGVTSPDDIRDPHLRSVVRWIVRRATSPNAGADVLARLVDTLEAALEQITPATDVHDQAHAMLLGRPMAVVRARIDIELQDPPATRQDLAALLTEMRSGTPVTDGFEHVQIPVRIGDHARLDDGVVGYWIEDGNQLGDLIAPQEAWGEDDEGRHVRTRPHDIWIAPADDPLTITMLVDPRGLVHATSGVLPTKVLDLPAPTWADAAAAIEVGFLTAPVLTSTDRIELVLPDGVRPSSWSWLERHDNDWTITPSTAVLDNAVFAREFRDEAPTIRADLLRVGWVEEAPHNALRILPVHRRRDDLTSAAPRFDAIVRVLDRAGLSIDGVLTDANFSPMHIREGWLQLIPPNRPSPTTIPASAPSGGHDLQTSASEPGETP